MIGDDVSDPSFGGGEPEAQPEDEPEGGELAADPEGDDDLDTGIEDDELTTRKVKRMRRLPLLVAAIGSVAANPIIFHFLK